MKQNILKNFVAGCLLLATLLSSTEWPVFSPVILAEAADHTHTDDCYVTTYCGTYYFKEYECNHCSAVGSYGEIHYKTSSTLADCENCGGDGKLRCSNRSFNADPLEAMSHHSNCDTIHGFPGCGGVASMTTYISHHSCSVCNASWNYYEYSCSSCGFYGITDGLTAGDGMHNNYDRLTCSTCEGTGQAYPQTECGVYTDDRYECSGCYDELGYDEGSHYKRGDLICDQVVIALVPLEPVQTPVAGSSINNKATATFLDGHTAEVECTVTGYDDSLYNTAQTVTFSYGTYKNNANTAGPYTVIVSITIQGEFSFTLYTEDAHKGTVSDSDGDIFCNDEVVIEAYPKTGYSFKGWYEGDNLVSSDNPYTFYMPGADTSYIARFCANSYNITVQSQNEKIGTVSGGGSIEYGSSITVVAIPNIGYSFVGWYDGTTLVSSDASYTFNMPAKDYALSAKFSAIIMTVTFDGNSGNCSTSTKTVTYGDTYGTLPTPTKDGYLFMGWMYGSSPITAGSAVKETRNHTLVASWSQVGVSSMTVIYDKVYADLPNPTRPGYTFNGWFYDETYNNGSGAKLNDGDVVKINTTTTVYAKWIPKEYTITFETNGGTCGIATKKYTYDKYYKEFPLPTREGYTFTGWYPSEYCTGTAYNEMDICNLLADAVFYAGWTKDPVTVTVSFHANGGMVGTTSKDVVYPGIYGTLPIPTKNGHSFNGWFTAKTDGTKITESSNVIGGYPHTLYAYWRLQECTVYLNDCGATSVNHTEKVSMILGEIGPSVIIPEKTGYTFLGYFTERGGNGTQYYDSQGNCTRIWTEENTNVLYAGWQQDSIIVPEEGEREEPTPLPGEQYEGIIQREAGRILLYADDYDNNTNALTDMQPYLTYDTAATEGVIPGTEAICIRGRMPAWMLEYKFIRRTGTDYVRVYVTVPYRTQYERSDDGELVISDVQEKTYDYLIPKTWSYWEVSKSGLYYPEQLIVDNKAIQGERVTINISASSEAGMMVPEYEIVQYGDKSEHVFWPEYDTDAVPVLRITLDEQYIISDVPDTVPDVEAYLSVVCGNAAWSDKRQANVRSDKFIFGEQNVLSDELVETGNGRNINEEALKYEEEEIALTSYMQSYLSGVYLDEYKSNGNYPTSAYVVYRGDKANIDAKETKITEISEVNALYIHTPVICNGVAVSGLEQREGEYDLILKEMLNFFTLSVDNNGIHRRSLGYGEKDFYEALSGKKNVAYCDGEYLNQICFPFDVYVDVGNDSQRADGSVVTTGDYILAADTWFSVGREEQQFYIPVTAKNGKYQIMFRTIAVNCPKDETGNFITEHVTQERANMQETSYVAADSICVEIKSYLRDFQIERTSDPAAEKQLAEGCRALVLKKGYDFSFVLYTQGEFFDDTAEIKVEPSFFWEDIDGTKRQEVELYHVGDFLKKIEKECYACNTEPLLCSWENHEVILQRFGGNGLIPADVFCVKKGFPLEEYAEKNTLTGRESFLLNKGYLIVSLDIKVKSNEGIWYTFDNWKITKLAADAEASGWKYVSGDVIRYDLSKSIIEDYEIGGSE